MADINLSLKDIETIISWGFAAHSHYDCGLSDHEDILLANLQSHRDVERIRNDQSVHSTD